MQRRSILYPGQKIVTTEGRNEIVAFVLFDQAFVYQPKGRFKLVEVCGDAWGGEADQEIGLAA